MNGDSSQDGLRQALGSVAALESRLEESLRRLSDETGGYLEAPLVADRLHSRATARREALEAHLGELGETDVPPLVPTIATALDAPSEQQGQGTVDTLRAVATELTQIAFAYTLLHGVAHRFFQKPTADLAEQHQKEVFDAAEGLQQATGDMVVQELQEAGMECQCGCPACSPGICLCWHVHVEPAVPSEGIVVRAPRAGSNAESAGLLHGDVILAVDGNDVGSYQEMLERMRDHEPGEPVELRIRRGTAEPQELVVTR